MELCLAGEVLQPQGTSGGQQMRLIHAISILAFSAVLAVPAAATADGAYTTADINMRAGPHAEFPRVANLPAGVAVTVHGCTYDWSWCDAGWRGLRGWVSARYLEYPYEGRRVYLPDHGERIGLPNVLFQFTAYWDRWYSDTPWYRERDRWYSAWMGEEGDDRFAARSRSAAAVDRDRSSSRSRSGDLPPGIAKKGRNFCPPGQAKKGRC
jgi:uncharacterized protein YraI